MPEYLSPGVFIEEVPSSLKAIEGVSTSTAAFVGPAARGLVPGYAFPGSPEGGLPFRPTEGFVLSPDPSPVLVTSYPEYQREFGPPLPLPAPGQPDFGYLGHALRAFFDNGGKRAYIARIVDKDTATPGMLRVGQGVPYRLLRSAAASENKIFLTSTRGLSRNDKMVFIRHADGSDALSGADAATVTAVSATEPLALLDGDAITITPGPGAPIALAIVAKPAIATSAAGPFAIADGDALEIRIGPPGEPMQTIAFDTADPATPITAGAATAAEVVAVLTRFLNGVRRVAVDTGRVVVETDARGTAAGLAVVGGTAAAALNFTVAQAAGSNVPDANRISVADLAAIPAVAASPDIRIGRDGAGHLQFSSRAVGTSATLALAETTPGSLTRLGFTGALTDTGAGAAAAPMTIASYDMKENSITFTTPLPRGLAAGEVYATVAAGSQPPVENTGALFYARTPGAWSRSLRVLVSPADRAPVPIVSVNVPLNAITVQTVASFYVGAVVELDHNGQSRSIHQVTTVNAPLRQITLAPGVPAPPIVDGWVRVLEIDIVIDDESGANPTESYRNVSWNQDSGFADLRRHYAWQINARSRLVWVQPPGIGQPARTGANREEARLAHQPCTSGGFPLSLALAGTLGDDGSPPGDTAYIGQDHGPGRRSGIQSLRDVTEARIIAAPGQTSVPVQLELIAQCELLRYRFAVLDGEAEPQAGSLTSILAHRNVYDTSYAAYYQPWITVTVDRQNRQLPPSGYLAGIYARVDNARGVWKAPANEPVRNAVGLKTQYTTGEQDLLNPRGVNLIRRFDVGGIRAWGARTLSSDPDVKYINVRRTLVFLEASIDRGTQWVVFEPNTPATWTRLVNSVSAFLLTQWRNGALFGRKPEQAFFVRCDEGTMTADDILNGRLICQIGVAIVRPAEFVIFRIEQITQFSASQ